MNCLKKYVLLALAGIVAVSPATTYAAIDQTYSKYNKDIYEIYKKYTKENGEFNINDVDTYFYSLKNKNDKPLNLKVLKEGSSSIYDVLNGSYFVYGYPFGAERNRPSTLTYDVSLRGDTENQYMGEDNLGAYFDNPAFPWRTWIMEGKALKDWDFIKRPWREEDIITKYKLNKNGSSFYDTNVNLMLNIKVGIYAKYIYLSAKETIQSLSNEQMNKSIYFGKVITGATLLDAFNFADPTVFKTKGGTWKDYVYILSPPTTSTWGTGYMFHKYTSSDNKEVIDYITVPLAPFDLVKKLENEMPKYTDNIDGCFLSEPVKEGNNMVAYVIRAPRFEIDSPVKTNMTVWLKENLDESQEFDNQTNLGKKLFEGEVYFTKDMPYWIYKVTYPVPQKGKISGIYVKTGNQKSIVSNSVWYASSGSLMGSSHTTSKDTELVDWMPWEKIESDTQYKIKKQAK